MRRFLLSLLILGAAGAAEARAPCPAGLHAATTAELFFGRDVGQDVGVSEADWRQFVDQEISPRFPRGLTVADVFGQWRGPKGDFVREPAKALFVVLDGAPSETGRLADIRQAYRARFHQDSVLLITQPACVSF